MAKYISVIIVLIALFVGCYFAFNPAPRDCEQIFRMHIRANSNEQVDQDIKLVIRDEFVNYLTPKLELVTTKSEAMQLVENEKLALKSIADSILSQNGFNYTRNIKVCNEFFPERYYGEFQVEQGYYDALICELGEAKGNNWWCVVYPPLCFVDYKTSNNVVYKSKLWEIINKFFNKERV